MQASIRLDQSVVTVAVDDTVHVLVELEAPPSKTDVIRPPLDLVAVIDRSGSMNGQPIEAVKSAIDLLVRLIGPDDRLALISFDDQVDVNLPLEHHTAETASPHISRIFARGSTNLSGGWLKAVELLSAARPEAARKIILLTDGHANVGITDSVQLLDLAGAQAQHDISTTTIGYGLKFDEELLGAIADAGQGNAYFAEGPDDAPRIFGSEFDGLSSIVAQNLSVEIRVNQSVSVVNILNDYPTSPAEHGVTISLGDAYDNEKRSLIAKLQVPGLADLGPAVIAELVLRYTAIGEVVKLHTITIPVEINVTDAATAQAAGVDDAVVEEVLNLNAVSARKQARRLSRKGDISAASKILSDTANDIRTKSAFLQSPIAILAEADDLESDRDQLANPATTSLSAKAMWAKERSMSRKRGARGHDTQPSEE